MYFRSLILFVIFSVAAPAFAQRDTTAIKRKTTQYTLSEDYTEVVPLAMDTMLTDFQLKKVLDQRTPFYSNLGNYGVEMFTPVINLPQAGILGVNTIIERPARMEDGTFGFVPYMGLSLTYDHRVLDGGPATLFLAEIKREIEQFNHELINL